MASPPVADHVVRVTPVFGLLLRAVADPVLELLGHLLSQVQHLQVSLHGRKLKLAHAFLELSDALGARYVLARWHVTWEGPHSVPVRPCGRGCNGGISGRGAGAGPER